MSIVIKCRSCRKFRRVEAQKQSLRESSRTLPVCHATNNVLVVVDDKGQEIMRPTANDVLFGRIQPDAGCPRVRAARLTGLVMAADFIILPDGMTRQWLQDIIY
jgi:hypothetical protein